MPTHFIFCSKVKTLITKLIILATERLPKSVQGQWKLVKTSDLVLVKSPSPSQKTRALTASRLKDVVQGADATTRYTLRGANALPGSITYDWNDPALTEYTTNGQPGTPPSTSDRATNQLWQYDAPSPISIDYPEVDALNDREIYSSDDGITWTLELATGSGNSDNLPLVVNKPKTYWQLVNRVGSTQMNKMYIDFTKVTSVKVISKTDEAPWQIVVDGGNWSDGTDIVGDIIPMTDKGFYYDDPNIDPNYGDPQPIFDPGINSNYTLIRRDHAWTEFEFVTPINVTSAVHLQGGAYYAGNAAGSHNFRVYINGTKIDNTDPASKLWFTSALYTVIQVIPFTGQMTSLRIESVDAGDPDESLVTGVFGGGTAVSNIFVDGETESDKIVGTVVQTEPGQTKLTKETPYDTKLTVSGGKDLEDMVAGDPMVMSDGTPPGGEYPRKEYKLVTTDIESVDQTIIATYILFHQVGLSTAGISNQTEAKRLKYWFNLDKDSDFSGSNIACFWSQKDSSSRSRAQTSPFNGPITKFKQFGLWCQHTLNSFCPRRSMASLCFNKSKR